MDGWIVNGCMDGGWMDRWMNVWLMDDGLEGWMFG